MVSFWNQICTFTFDIYDASEWLNTHTIYNICKLFQTIFSGKPIDNSYSKGSIKLYWIYGPKHFHNVKCSHAEQHYDDELGIKVFMSIPISTHIPWTKWSPFRSWYCQIHVVNEKFCILVTVSLKFVPKGLIDNNPSLVQIMVWRRIGGNPLYGPMIHWRIYTALMGD